MDPLLLLGVLGGYTSLPGVPRKITLAVLLRGFRRTLQDLAHAALRGLLGLKSGIVTSSWLPHVKASLQGGVLSWRSATLASMRAAVVQALARRLVAQGVSGNLPREIPTATSLYTLRLFPTRWHMSVHNGQLGPRRLQGTLAITAPPPAPRQLSSRGGSDGYDALATYTQLGPRPCSKAASPENLASPRDAEDTAQICAILARMPGRDD